MSPRRKLGPKEAVHSPEVAQARGTKAQRPAQQIRLRSFLLRTEGSRPADPQGGPHPGASHRQAALTERVSDTANFEENEISSI